MWWTPVQILDSWRGGSSNAAHGAAPPRTFSQMMTVAWRSGGALPTGCFASTTRILSASFSATSTNLSSSRSTPPPRADTCSHTAAVAILISCGLRGSNGWNRAVDWKPYTSVSAGAAIGGGCGGHRDSTWGWVHHQSPRILPPNRQPCPAPPHAPPEVRFVLRGLPPGEGRARKRAAGPEAPPHRPLRVHFVPGGPTGARVRRCDDVAGIQVRPWPDVRQRPAVYLVFAGARAAPATASSCSSRNCWTFSPRCGRVRAGVRVPARPTPIVTSRRR